MLNPKPNVKTQDLMLKPNVNKIQELILKPKT